MKVLYLGPARAEVSGFIVSGGDDVVATEERVTTFDAEFIVSYGYRHVLPREVVSRFVRRAVNLHISLLPWNRGADPNLWSFLEDTPKGVTIHYLDQAIDSGDIVAQRAVEALAGDTLRTSYERLSREVERLFFECWPKLRAGTIRGRPQPPGGSFHRAADRAAVEHLLPLGWDTPVAQLIGQGIRT